MFVSPWLLSESFRNHFKDRNFRSHHFGITISPFKHVPGEPTSSSLTSKRVHEQISRSGDQSEARPPVFKSPSKLGTHLSTLSSRDERLSQPCPDRK
ncbi:hypothetical protein TNCV_4260181 [Trichonephila clavipes]|nr:hypothetical protein TNCV_4260181 [Trichonephila clavipes]